MNKKGLTLIELVISITITSVLFSFIFVFISDSIDGVGESNIRTQIMDNIFNTKNKILRYVKSGYISNNVIGTGGISNKVLYLKTEDDSKGVIFGIVNFDTMKLQAYNIYGNNNIGYRDLSTKEIQDVDLDNEKIYDMLFHRDKIIDNVLVKSFDPELYNSGVFIDLNIEYLNQFNNSYLGKSFSGIFIKKDDIYKTNLVF